MTISLELISRENAAEIYDFEIENRDFFERALPSRGDDYYNIDHFNETIGLIMEDQQAGTLYMHVIRNEEGEMVGRINLFPLENEARRTFELGYRIGERHLMKGYGKKAVKMLLDKAFGEYGIEVIEAASSPNNIGSQIILLRNGFEFVRRIKDDIEVKGQLEDSVIFLKEA